MFADVSIICRGEEVRVHKCVLFAYDAFFRDIFATSDQVYFTLCDESVTRKELNDLIELIYTGSVHSDADSEIFEREPRSVFLAYDEKDQVCALSMALLLGPDDYFSDSHSSSTTSITCRS